MQGTRNLNKTLERLGVISPKIDAQYILPYTDFGQLTVFRHLIQRLYNLTQMVDVDFESNAGLWHFLLTWGISSDNFFKRREITGWFCCFLFFAGFSTYTVPPVRKLYCAGFASNAPHECGWYRHTFGPGVSFGQPHAHQYKTICYRGSVRPHPYRVDGKLAVWRGIFRQHQVVSV